MLFNSVEFFVFLPLVFVLYWLLIPQKAVYQNILILVASYFFYAWWDYRFLSLIIISTVIDYVAGRYIHSSDKALRKKVFMWMSVATNLGLLGFFKYFNFFIESWRDAWLLLGVEMDVNTLQIILPLGISFYTFQSMSYTLDIYNGKLKPSGSLLDFAAYVAFFPQLVAGPIERASKLLPQISALKKFDYQQAVEGLRLILWGFFKKVVIADTLSIYTQTIFGDPEQFQGTVLLLGSFYFAIQIYTDFSGYSDIAIGTAKLFGVELMSNFKFPYFTRNISEYWKRWHISLTSWLNDYVYLPMAIRFRYWGRFGICLAIFLTFLISGLWHGAGWHFVVWGGIHGLLYIPLVYQRKVMSISGAQQDVTFRFVDILKMILTFTLVSFSLVFFRAQSLEAAFDYFYYMFTGPLIPTARLQPLIYMVVMLALDFFFRKDERNIFAVFKHRWARYAVYLVLFFAVLNAFSVEAEQQFIYFQF